MVRPGSCPIGDLGWGDRTERRRLAPTYHSRNALLGMNARAAQPPLLALHKVQNVSSWRRTRPIDAVWSESAPAVMGRLIQALWPTRGIPCLRTQCGC